MIRKSTITRAGMILALAFSLNTVKAQDIHFTQFNASPLILNPAFTGDFNGLWRAAAIYRNQWGSVTVPYVTYGVSFDAPVVYDLSMDDYLAAGIQLTNDRAGDGNLTNFAALASVAYHKFFGMSSNSVKSLSVGFQGGYYEQSIDLSKLYFGDEFFNGQFNQGTGVETQGLNNRVHYFTVNAGVSWAQMTSTNFSYQLGVGANNLNQPLNGFEKKSNAQNNGIGMRYTAQAGFIWYTGDKFSLRPGVLFQSQATATELVAGNEFHYIISDDPEVRSFATAVFLGLWYRSSDAAMITLGMEYKSFRFGISYDYNISDLKTATNGNGAYELSIRYIMPNPIDFAHKFVYPCSRF